jgi:hypothetical protein
MGAWVIDERGNIKKNVIDVSYRAGDNNKYYNFYGNTRDGETSLAGLFRYI